MTREPADAALADLEAKAAAGERFGRSDAARLLEAADLVAVGLIGDTARKRLSGDAVTFCRVAELAGAEAPPTCGEAGEVRVTGAVASLDEAVARVRRARTVAGDRPVTGFSAIDLLEMCHGQLEALGRSAARLREAGLEAVAECPVDRFGSLDAVLAAIRALSAGGLGVPRLTIDHAPADRRLELIERAAAIRDATGFIQAFAPLPRRDSADQPSTGYDDVRTVAVARLVARDIPSIQVDWPLYGPKLAQVALLYGANDVDGIAAIEPPGMGPRRSPAEDIRRQIRAAMGVPVERNGRYEHLS